MCIYLYIYIYICMYIQRISLEDMDDAEMDGKQLSATSSHPEVSTTSPSLEFGLLSLGMGSAIQVHRYMRG
jgi:hypothetical protein